MDTVQIGIVVSIITQICKFLPFINTKAEKKLLALVISIIAVVIYVVANGVAVGMEIAGLVVLVLSSSYITFKTVIKSFATEK